MAITIGIVVFDDIIPFHLSVPCAVFEKALDEKGEAAYQLLVCAIKPGPLRTNAGFSITAEHSLADLDRADMVIVPSWSDPNVIPPAELIAALLKAHQRGARLIGLCMGAFVLAATGLLNNKQATTHWRWTPEFLQRYPKVSVDRDVLYVDLGDIVTSAGTAASIDCCLYLVRQQCGADSANAVARLLVVSPHRQGGQAQYIERPIYNTQSGHRFMTTLNWATENLHQTITLDQMAEKARMSRRNFTRRFNQTIGSSFSQWLLNQRIAVAQRFLEKTDQPVELIAGLVGFSSAMVLRRHFKKQLNISPLQYRKAFCGNHK